jgi:hypothetical protein
MSSSSGRAQTEPLAALAAVFVVAIGMSLYAGVLDDALDGTPERDVAEPTLDRVERTVAPDGVVTPGRLSEAIEHAPAGYKMNASVLADGRTWSVGPVPPNATVDRANTRLAVAVTPTVNDQRAGRANANHHRR